jgi:RNA polymerase sigma-70 factor, ECF subfamily
LRLIITYVKRNNIAEDLLQEVFVKVYKNLNRFQGDSSIRTWIFSIAINQCRDYTRSAYYRYIYLSEKISSITKGNAKSPEEIFIEQFGNHLLTMEIMKLPLKYREVIFLYYYQELKVREMAVVLNVNENTIKSRLVRAKNILKNQYQEGEDRDGERIKTFGR